MTWAERARGTAAPQVSLDVPPELALDDVSVSQSQRRPPTTKDALSRATDLDPKEKDQLRLHVQLQRKALRIEKEKELESFRHEQMLKRWESGNTAKPSKVIFLSDVVAPARSAPAHPPPADSSLAAQPSSSTTSVAPHRHKNVSAPLSLSAEAPPQHLPSEERKVGKQRMTAKRKKPTDVKLLVLSQREEAFRAIEARIESYSKQSTKHVDVAPLASHVDLLDEDAVDSTKGDFDAVALVAGNQNPESCAECCEPETANPAAAAELVTCTSVMDGRAAADIAEAEIVATIRSLIDKMQATFEQSEASRLAKDENGFASAIKELRHMQRTVHRLMKPRGKAAPGLSSEKAVGLVGKNVSPHDDALKTSTTTKGPTSAQDAEQSSAMREELCPVEEDDAETTAICASLVRNAPVQLFHPTLADLRVGQHPLAHLIDRRSSANPVELDQQGLVRAVDDASSSSKLSTAQEPSGAMSRGASVAPVRFVREYVVNVMTDSLDSAVFSMLRKLVIAQKKLHDTQPQHLKARMRYCTGLRETLRGVLSRKVKLLLISPDVEPVAGEDSVTFLEEFEDSPLLIPHAAGGESGSNKMDDVVQQSLRERALDDASSNLGKQLQRRTVKSLGLDGSVRALVTLCRLKSIPFVFCMGKKRFAYALKIPYAKVSSVAVLSSEGAHDEYRAVVKLASALRDHYQDIR